LRCTVLSYVWWDSHAQKRGPVLTTYTHTRSVLLINKHMIAHRLCARTFALAVFVWQAQYWSREKRNGTSSIRFFSQIDCSSDVGCSYSGSIRVKLICSCSNTRVEFDPPESRRWMTVDRCWTFYFLSIKYVNLWYFQIVRVTARPRFWNYFRTWDGRQFLHRAWALASQDLCKNVYCKFLKISLMPRISWLSNVVNARSVLMADLEIYSKFQKFTVNLHQISEIYCKFLKIYLKIYSWNFHEGHLIDILIEVFEFSPNVRIAKMLNPKV
jgi:hypothetical protein